LLQSLWTWYHHVILWNALTHFVQYRRDHVRHDSVMVACVQTFKIHTR
jgi:hypothetical protein